MGRLALGVVAAASLPRALAAQVVAGQVVSAAAGAPVENAVVVLLDSARRQLGGALSDAAGRFALRAPAAGHYWVRADRVGSASALGGPVAVAVGDTVRLRLALAEGRRLSAVRVTARERCRVRPEEGAYATVLWDAVRTALEGTTLALDAQAFPFSLERFERALDPGDRRLVREDRWINPAARELFASAPAAELQRLGWVRADTGAVTEREGDDEASEGNADLRFFGPDARVLLSDAFVDAHCLRAIAPPATRAGQVGLAFEPVSRRRPALPDVRGTLWLDTATSELRDLEFEYTDLPRPIGRHRPGGSIAFARMPNGLWYVSRWTLRMPVLIRPDSLQRPVLESIREVGGRTLRDEDMTHVPSTLALLDGVVIDSTDDYRPMPNARVSVVGTPYNAITDANGRFRLELPDSGTATLSVSHPRLTALGVRASAVAPLVLGRETALPVGFPSAATIRRQLCGPTEGDTTAVVVGAAWDQGLKRGVARLAAPRRGVSVDVLWRVGDQALATTTRRTARTDAMGHFHLCGVAAGVELLLRPPALSVGPSQSSAQRWTATVRRGGLLVLEWVIVRTPGGSIARQRVDDLLPAWTR